MNEIRVAFRLSSLEAPPGKAVPSLATAPGHGPDIGAMAL